MNKELAKKYLEYDNQVNYYFDKVLLDCVTKDFHDEYVELRERILEDIFKKENGYDDEMIKLIEHYNTIINDESKEVIKQQTELLMIDHYMNLCGYTVNKDGYWEEKND